MSQPASSAVAVLAVIAALLLISGCHGANSLRYQQYQLQLQQQQQQSQQQPQQFESPVAASQQRGPMRLNYYRTDQSGSASNQQPAPLPLPNNGDPPPMMRIGMSAWALIALIVFIILVGMAIYYGVMCYPIFCGKEGSEGSMYNTMREASSTSSGTPLGNYENEKMGNYSSRSTTPTKSREAFDREAQMND